MGKRNCIAIWGAPGVGKSLTAVKLAWHYQMQNMRTALLFCNLTTPILPCMVREEELLKKHSLGSTFAAKTVTPELIAANVCTVKGIKNLYLYGLLKGEHTLAYPMIGERQANELMAELKKQYDVVIADCTANLTENLLSIAALKHADSVVRLYGCDFKTLSFYSSIGWEIEKCGLDSARFYKVISDVRDIERMRKMYQKPEFYLMHSEELCRQYFAGDVFRNLERKESRLYCTQLSVLADELIT